MKTKKLKSESGGVSPHTTAGQPSGPSLPKSGEVFPPACLRRGEVAELLQASVSTVDRLVVDGHLQRVKVRRLVRFSPTEVEAYIKQKAESACRPGH